MLNLWLHHSGCSKVLVVCNCNCTVSLSKLVDYMYLPRNWWVMKKNLIYQDKNRFCTNERKTHVRSLITLIKNRWGLKIYIYIYIFFFLKKICKLWLGRAIWVSNSSTLHLSWIIINQKNNLSWTKMSHFSYQNKGDDFSYMFSTLQFKNNYFLKLIERVIVWHDTNTKYKPTITISCESNMDENQLLFSIS